MNNENFDKIVEETICQIKDVLQSKAKEYARNDRLSNFKRAAQLRNCSPIRALEGMMTKHIISIYDYIDDLETSAGIPTLTSWDEKIGDTINYLILLKALLKERYE